MFIMPDNRIVHSAFQVMENALQELYRSIESEGHGDNPKKAMATIKMFAIATMLRLHEKSEALGPGFSDQLLDSVNGIRKKDIIEKEIATPPQKEISKDSVLVDEEPDEFTQAIFLLSNRIVDGIEECFEKLPPLLRNDETLLCALSVIVAQFFSKCGYTNLDTFIDEFSKDVRIYAEAIEEDKISNDTPS